MADPAPVSLDILARPQLWLRGMAIPLGGLGLAMVLMGVGVNVYSPVLWKVAVLFAAVGAVTMALAALLWVRADRRGPLLVIRADSLGLPQMAAGKARAPTRLRWTEIEALALTGPEDAPEALVLVLTADASRQRGVAVPTVPDDQPHVANRIRLRLTLEGLSETPRRIGESVVRAAEGAGLVRGAGDAGVAHRLLEGTLGTARRWIWPENG
jgi:hypothetical protein